MDLATIHASLDAATAVLVILNGLADRGYL
jgi:hypothetical protein